MSKHNILGKKGEMIALDYLKEKKYIISDSNWRFEKYELDIIAENNEFLVIVEVKTRSSSFFGEPEASISKGKIRRIVDATQAYIETFDILKETRFDVISIIYKNENTYELEHFEDAFYPAIE